MSIGLQYMYLYMYNLLLSSKRMHDVDIEKIAYSFAYYKTEIRFKY